MSFAYCSAPLASIQEVALCCFILEKVKCSTFPKENIRGSTSGQSVADPNSHKLVSSISFSFTVFLQVCRNRSTRSLPFYLILSTCIVTGLWSIYGILWIDTYHYIRVAFCSQHIITFAVIRNSSTIVFRSNHWRQLCYGTKQVCLMIFINLSDHFQLISSPAWVL